MKKSIVASAVICLLFFVFVTCIPAQSGTPIGQSPNQSQTPNIQFYSPSPYGDTVLNKDSLWQTVFRVIVHRPADQIKTNTLNVLINGKKVNVNPKIWKRNNTRTVLHLKFTDIKLLELAEGSYFIEVQLQGERITTNFVIDNSKAVININGNLVTAYDERSGIKSVRSFKATRKGIEEIPLEQLDEFTYKLPDSVKRDSFVWVEVDDLAGNHERLGINGENRAQIRKRLHKIIPELASGTYGQESHRDKGGDTLKSSADTCKIPLHLVGVDLYNDNHPQVSKQTQQQKKEKQLEQVRKDFQEALDHLNNLLSVKGYKTLEFEPEYADEIKLVDWWDHSLSETPLGFHHLKPTYGPGLELFGYQLDWKTFKVDEPPGSEEMKAPFGVEKKKNDFIVHVFDRILEPSFVEDDIIGGQTNVFWGWVFLNYGVWDPYWANHRPMTLAHELAHALGLDHWPDKTHLMYADEEEDQAGYGLGDDELKTILAHVCGDSADPQKPLPFIDQFDSFGINKDYTGTSGECGNALIGPGEECDKTLLEFNDLCVDPGPNDNDVPFWPHSDNHICFPACLCAPLILPGPFDEDMFGGNRTPPGPPDKECELRWKQVELVFEPFCENEDGVDQGSCVEGGVPGQCQFSFSHHGGLGLSFGCECDTSGP